MEQILLGIGQIAATEVFQEDIRQNLYEVESGHIRPWFKARQHTLGEVKQ